MITPPATKPLGIASAPPHPVVTAGALIENTKGEIFLIFTHKWGHRYGIPGGKIEYGETAEAAVKREIHEETGMTLSSVNLLMVQEVIKPREFYIPDMHLISMNYHAKTDCTAYTLNDEAQSGVWITPELALELPLNEPTRILLERFVAAQSNDGPLPVVRRTC